MSARAYAAVRIGRDPVTLLPEHPVGIGKDDKPEAAAISVRCDACGKLTGSAAPVTYKYYDDDHYGRLEVWYESRHEGGCSGCASPFDIELSYTLTTYPGSGRVEFSLDQLESTARRRSGGAVAFAAAEDLLATLPPKAGPPLPVARSSAECHLYMVLNPCACGEPTAPAQHQVVQGKDGLVAQYRGQCPKCQQARAFDFALDPETPPMDGFGGGKPSRLICPGQFALHADRLASRWPADTAGLTEAQRAQAREDLHWAARALEEVLKFIPEGGNEVAPNLFTSAEGRKALAAEPGRFRKIRLEARLDAYRRLLAAPPAPLPTAPVTEATAPAGDDSVWLTCLDVAPRENLFAVGRQDGAVIMADLTSGNLRQIEPLHTDRVSSVVFDGSMLWTAGFDGHVVCWDPALREVRRRFDAGHGRILMLRLSGSDRLLTVGDDGNARLWDKAGGAALQTMEEKRFGAAYSVAATPDWIALGYQDGHVGIWIPAAAGAPGPWAYDGHMEPAGRRGSPLYAIAVSRADDLVAFARDRRVTLCTPGTWKRIAELETDLACNDLQFDAKGETLIGACSERRVRLWRREMVEPPADRQRRGRRPMQPGARLMSIWNRFGDSFGAGLQAGPWEQTLIYSGVRFAGDTQAIATSFDGTVQLFDVKDRLSSPRRVARFGRSAPTAWSE